MLTMIPQTTDHDPITRDIAGVSIVSSPSKPTAKSPSQSERAALAQAVKLIAGKPGMSPASALRKAGIKSAAKIKQLSVELRRQQADRGQRKGSNLGGRRQSNRGEGAATAKALSTSRGASKKGAVRHEKPAGKYSPETALAFQSDLMSNWLKFYVGWWSQMMKLSPLGIMTSASSADNSRRDRASLQWFSNLQH
jgi:hypothetical protein